MTSVYKKIHKRPLPDDFVVVVRKRNGESVKIARWKDGKDRYREAELHEDGQHIKVESRYYYARYVDGQGIYRRVSTECSDKQAAEQVLRDLIANADAVRSGIVTQGHVDAKHHAKRPIGEHIDDYVRYLEHKTTRGKRTSSTHVANVQRQIKRLVADCQIKRLADISKGKIARWMHAQEDEGQVAGRTINTHRSAALAFCRWCVLDGRLTTNPLVGLYTADETEKKRQRRALTEPEIAKLLQVTRERPLLDAMTVTQGPNKGKRIAKVKPEQRERLARLGLERSLTFETMIYTGLRLSELAALKVSDIHLDEQSLYIEIRASDAKDAKTDQVAIPPHLAAKLQEWVSRKMPQTRLFNVPRGLRSILYRDLALADIQKLDKDGRPIPDGQGRKIDVHALRHTAGTQLAKHGVLPQVASKQMRHSSLDMTMKHYTHLAIEDKIKAVDHLPVYDGGFGTEADKKTGTDDADFSGARSGVTDGVKGGVSNGARPQARIGSDCHSDSTDTKQILGKQPLEGSLKGSFVSGCHQKDKCPGEDSNLHCPKATSPSS